MTAHMFKHAAAETIQVMAEEGIDISHHPVTAVTPELVKNADRVVVLCEPEVCPPYVLQHPNLLLRPVDDPWAKNIEEFRSAREQIRLIVQELLPDNLPIH